MEPTSGNDNSIQTNRMSIHALVRELNDNVGATVVQTMAGVRERTSPNDWASQDGPEPPPNVEARLRLGYRVWRTLTLAMGPHEALAWLMGSNPRLDGQLPVLFIQHEREAEVLGAAMAFVNDTAA